ncbi:hypothetical protein SKDZ_13G3690 [Saccharomyces kudriavzevii ZP591]|nr:hypothetical protein SKDZ_13G3690 [Saccharomyces kudriavzevii ZP591]
MKFGDTLPRCARDQPGGAQLRARLVAPRLEVEIVSMGLVSHHKVQREMLAGSNLVSPWNSGRPSPFCFF